MCIQPVNPNSPFNNSMQQCTTAEKSNLPSRRVCASPSRTLPDRIRPCLACDANPGLAKPCLAWPATPLPAEPHHAQPAIPCRAIPCHVLPCRATPCPKNHNAFPNAACRGHAWGKALSPQCWHSPTPRHEYADVIHCGTQNPRHTKYSTAMLPRQ